MDMTENLDKSWDHPWATEEMKKKRREWSLAGDVGLLKHLQQFSENLMSKANKTQAALGTLTTQLKETEILVDNVTNTSLALANTQFIESRVQEDDMEIKENSERKQEEVKKIQDSAPENLLASISESVKQGLNIMDEKYRMMDVACSDSEEDDDGEVVVSVMVGPNDPYQDRPLPYVIGSNKWLASNKIGLESSSSESEQLDEEREESESDKEEDSSTQKIFNSRHNPEMNIARSSSSSDSDNYNNLSNDISYMNNKPDAVSQNNVNSASESITPNNVSKTSDETTPNFAEELAKRLGTVRQEQKPVTVNEANESLINRYKDDLFTAERNEDVFNDDPDNLFQDKKVLFDDKVSTNLWKDKPIKSYKNNNIISPSIDVPPPINVVSTKPKSAIDDLFADIDSEEDSDDIFSSKNVVTKKRTKDSSTSSNTYSVDKEDTPRTFLDVAAPTSIDNIATSTPEFQANVLNLFVDDENDDGDLFGVPKKQSQLLANASLPINAIQESSKKKPVGGVSILKHILASDIESKLSSRKMRRQSSDSSDSDALGNDNATEPVSIKRNISNDNASNHSSIIAAPRNPVENISANIENSSSSGISVPPSSSIDNTAGSGLWLNFQPEMSSTRLKSEEIYRERIGSDSLFSAQTRNPANANSSMHSNSNNNSNNNQRRPQQEQDVSSILLQDDVFDNNDLFGPPPLPSKSDAKRVKSKVSSLFDDSDSGDELFSATSSGSRSQKSTDFLAVSLGDKAKSAPRGSGLFDDNTDIFSGKDCPDVDLFGTTSKSISKNATSDDLFDSHGQNTVAPKSSNVNTLPSTKTEPKKISLFGDDDGDDGDLFGAKPKSKNERKTDLFDDEENLFVSSKVSNKGFSSVKKDRSIESKSDVSEEILSGADKKSKDSPPESKLFSNTTKINSLLFEDDDYDDLFDKKKTMRENDRSRLEPKEKKERNLVIEEAQEFSEKNKSSITEPLNVDHDAKTIDNVESNIVVNRVKDKEKSERSKVDMENILSVKEDVDGITRKSPPKTLSIRTTPSPSEDGSQVPRRLVSGKIKNLMGKMGDLKILSPMDAPPLWRKSEEKTDEDEDVVDRDSDSGGQVTTGRVSSSNVSEGNTRKEMSSISTTNNAEMPINFDDLAQVETLSTAASKSRVRIQAKRRPQSRHARKSALRHSGIDFDTVDNADNDSQEDSYTNTFSHTSSTKDLSAALIGTDRLTVNDAQRMIDPVIDDKSELGSVSKESSMSVNKNTLLSPSTDEEDLFDVPPDLPEDPQKEDTLFGRAPILSPIGSEHSDKTPVAGETLKDTVIRSVEIDIDQESNENNKQDLGETRSDEVCTKSDVVESKIDERKDERCEEVNDEHDEAKTESSEEPSDPLRDSSHDPLKNPSQLFAFVTKTPSPDKGKGLLLSEDDSLFSSGVKKSNEEQRSKKEILDLFADDTGDDLFSAPLKKTVKKPLRDTKIGLFDDDDDDTRNDEDDSLFGSATNKKRFDAQKSAPIIKAERKKNIFDDNDNDDDDSSLFVESSGLSQKSDSVSEPKHESVDSAKNLNLNNIFSDDAPCDDDDIFATKTVVPKKVAPSKSLFASDDDDDDDGHIFGKPLASITDLKAKTTTANLRPAMKKPVTRDLKKTAEKIVEDPLSLLQDD